MENCDVFFKKGKLYLSYNNLLLITTTLWNRKCWCYFNTATKYISFIVTVYGKRSSNPKITQKPNAKDLGYSHSTITRYRDEFKLASPSMEEKIKRKKTNSQNISMNSFSVKKTFESISKLEDNEINDENDWDMNLNEKL